MPHSPTDPPSPDPPSRDPGAAPDLAHRPLYRHWTPEIVRYADLDILGHANNNAIGVYLESGRVALLHDCGGMLNGADTTAVAKRLTVDFRAELHWPARIDVGTCLLALGRTSFTLGTGLFDGARCIATAETVCVMIDQKTRRPVPLTEAEREALSRVAGLPTGV